MSNMLKYYLFKNYFCQNISRMSLEYSFEINFYQNRISILIQYFKNIFGWLGAPQSIDVRSLLLFLKAWVHMLFLELFDTVLMKSAKIHHHSKLSLKISHPLSEKNYPFTSPSFPLYLNSIPIYPILYTFLWKPTNHSSGGIVDDIAIHSPHNTSESEYKLYIHDTD